MKRKLLLLALVIMFLPLSATRTSAEEKPNYFVKVDTINQLTYIYSLNNANEYELMDVWATSTGTKATPTVQGTFTLKPLRYGKDGEWYYFKSWPCWVNYVTQIQGNYCFHTPPTNVRYDYAKTPMSSINQMLTAASHGCVRFLPRQAAFMWYNMGGCKAEIYKGEVTEETKALREKLLMEIPKSSANYPDPVITEHTIYWYTYHNDTVDKICSLSGITPEQLAALNPSIDFSMPIGIGQALIIKSTMEEPVSEEPAGEEPVQTDELQNDAAPAENEEALSFDLLYMYP